MSGDIMRIVPSNGYLYEIMLDHTTTKTGLWCDQWEDLFVHYGIDMYDEIWVILNEDPEFFRVIVFDRHLKEKNPVQEPG